MSDLSFLLLYLVLAFIITLVAIPPYIRLLVRFRLGKQIRQEALVGKADKFYELHKAKTGTPSMGGGVILLVIFALVAASVLVWLAEPWLRESFGIHFRYSLWNRNETYLALFTLFTMGIVGAVDDYLNVREIGRTKGLSARFKMVLLMGFAALGAWWFTEKLGHTSVALPIMGSIYLGWLYVPLFMLVVVGMANSVNITDGLDGLAGGLLLFNYAVYAFIAYSHGLFILSALCMIIVGTLVAFLWFNIKPAHFYMGDVGSLSLGATLAVIALMTDTLAALCVTALIFGLELLSVIIQITSKKLRQGKKVFAIAPFHHHLEYIGWKEETIVMRFWLIGVVLSVLGLVVALALR